jgi:hypothetical protein
VYLGLPKPPICGSLLSILIRPNARALSSLVREEPRAWRVYWISLNSTARYYQTVVVPSLRPPKRGSWFDERWDDGDSSRMEDGLMAWFALCGLIYDAAALCHFLSLLALLALKESRC